MVKLPLINGDIYMSVDRIISSEFTFESKYMEIRGEKIHYVDVGEGKPVLFIHGNPTSSYIWRNIIPGIPGRRIALDLIGMGRSSKPDIDYSFEQHYQFVEEFILSLELRDIHLVIHDWGAALGFEFAKNHPEKVRKITFMEPLLFPIPSMDDLTGDVGEFFKNVRDPKIGPEMIIEQNFFIEKMLPAMVRRELDEDTLRHYREPYLEKKARKPLLVWPLEVPISGEPMTTQGILSDLIGSLKDGSLSLIDKQLLYVEPGAMMPPHMAEYCKGEFPNLQVKYVGEGLHFIQEDNPHEIAKAIAEFAEEVE